MSDPRDSVGCLPSSGSRQSLLLPLLLAVAVIFTALAVVRIKHENRLLTTEIERLRQERERLDMEWAQLQLEEAALAHHGRIDRLAREHLGMSEPRDYLVVSLPKAAAAQAPGGVAP